MTAQQTHEKNLAWIDEAEEHHYYRFHEQDQENTDCIELRSLRANRKVLERHGPKEYPKPMQGIIEILCGACGVSYPCPTTIDITEGLDIK